MYISFIFLYIISWLPLKARKDNGFYWVETHTKIACEATFKCIIQWALKPLMLSHSHPHCVIPALLHHPAGKPHSPSPLQVKKRSLLFIFQKSFKRININSLIFFGECTRKAWDLLCWQGFDLHVLYWLGLVRFTEAYSFLIFFFFASQPEFPLSYPSSSSPDSVFLFESILGIPSLRLGSLVHLSA